MLLRDRERRWNQRRTRMDSAAGLGEIVKLEGVSESTIGERCRRRAHGLATCVENETVAAGAVCPCIRDDHLAPGQIGATDDGADSIGDAVLGALDHHWRQILIPYRDGVVGKMARRGVHSITSPARGSDNTVAAILMAAVAAVWVLLFALVADIRSLSIFNNAEFLMPTVISMTQAFVAILINARPLRRTIGTCDNG